MTKFLHGVRTTNEPSWVVPWLPQLIQDGGGRHLEFLKNVNNSGLHNLSDVEERSVTDPCS